MSTSERLTEVFEPSKKIVFGDNQSLLFHALDYYYINGFTHIGIGDRDELWENAKFEDIRE